MNSQDAVLELLLRHRIVKPTRYEFIQELAKAELPFYKAETIRRSLQKLAEREFLLRKDGYYFVPLFMLSSEARGNLGVLGVSKGGESVASNPLLTVGGCEDL